MAQKEASRKMKSWTTWRGTYSLNPNSFKPYLEAPEPKRSGFWAFFAFLGQVQQVAQGARPGDLVKIKKAITKTCGEWVWEQHTKRAPLDLQKKWWATVKNQREIWVEKRKNIKIWIQRIHLRPRYDSEGGL